ncbi:hypothetical protein, partial [Escherichia coli]|uniref:hypothetical protein n=1 Tax=Escherichia coli TaxID=562 RepID=UPI001BFC3CFB
KTSMMYKWMFFVSSVMFKLNLCFPEDFQALSSVMFKFMFVEGRKFVKCGGSRETEQKPQ